MMLYFKCFKQITCLSLCVLSLFITTPAFAITGDITTCFTPGGNCAQQIINAINHENNSVLVQAYQLTSADIAKALVDAKRRGVTVKIILFWIRHNIRKNIILLQHFLTMLVFLYGLIVNLPLHTIKLLYWGALR